MGKQPQVYGLDIETDTSRGGLDPRCAGIIAAAVSTRDGDLVFTGEEAGLLASLDRYLLALNPGIIVTWNGAAFDLPYIASRAEALGVRLGLHLTFDAGEASNHPPLAGHLGRYRAVWHHHRHLDAYRGYRAATPEGTSCGLKATARREGLCPVEANAATVHDLPLDGMRRYVASDASAARVLALAQWPSMAAHLDPKFTPRAPALFHLAGV